MMTEEEQNKALDKRDERIEKLEARLKQLKKENAWLAKALSDALNEEATNV